MSGACTSVVGLASSAGLHAFRVPSMHCSMCVSVPCLESKATVRTEDAGRCRLCASCHVATSLIYQTLLSAPGLSGTAFSLASVPHNLQSQVLGGAENQVACHLLTLMWQEKEAVTVKCQNQAEVTVIPLPVWTSQGDTGTWQEQVHTGLSSGAAMQDSVHAFS